jgi:hypothetical protein
MLSSVLLACGAVLAVSRASPLHPYERDTSSATPLPPSQDPFYTAPENYQLAAPGTILRSREAPGNLASVIGNCSAAYNILYRTTDSHHQPSWAVTTLLVPLTEASSRRSCGDALLSYQIPYDSADVDDSPSYALYSEEVSDLPAALGRGWYVNVPDYEGPLASFTAGVQSGHATLDSVRAALSSEFGPSSDARYAMWGYSGGALASEWAAELQVQYAPELEFSGAALGGLTPNITSVLHSVSGSVYAGLVPSGLLGLASQYPDFDQSLLQALNPSGQYNKTGFLAARGMSQVETFEYYGDEDIFDYFIDGSAYFNTPLVKDVLSTEGNMGYHGVPHMPVFAYKAIEDTLSVIADTDALVNKYCEEGTKILYQRNTVGGHEAESVNGVASAFEWLDSVFDGTLHQPSCVIQDVTIAIDISPY